MNRLRIVILSIYVLIGTTGMVSGADYYFDSKAGDDGRDGLSALTAWKTLQKAVTVKLKAGDRILLEKLIADGRNTPGLPQKNDVAVQIRKMDTKKFASLRKKDDSK